MTTSRVQTALTVLPVLSAGLYLMGATYHQGYLDAFGVDDSLFPLASDKALLSGFLALVSFGLVPMLYTIFAALFLAFTVMISAVLSSHPRVKHWLSVVLFRRPKWRIKTAPSAAMNDLVDRSAIIYGYCIGVFLLTLSLVFVAILSGKSGREQAIKEIRSFDEQVGNFATLHTPLLPSPIRTKQIICGQSHCAFWLGSDSLVLRHESVERLVMHNPTVHGPPRDRAAQRR